jgi:hypothetical protein
MVRTSYFYYLISYVHLNQTSVTASNLHKQQLPHSLDTSIRIYPAQTDKRFPSFVKSKAQSAKPAFLLQYRFQVLENTVFKCIFYCAVDSSGYTVLSLTVKT